MRSIIIFSAVLATLCAFGPLLIALCRRAETRRAVSDGSPPKFRRVPSGPSEPGVSSLSPPSIPVTLGRIAPDKRTHLPPATRQRRSLEGNVGRLVLLICVIVVAGLFLTAAVSGGVVRELGWLLTIGAALGAAGYLAFRSPEPPQS